MFCFENKIFNNASRTGNYYQVRNYFSNQGCQTPGDKLLHREGDCQGPPLHAEVEANIEFVALGGVSSFERKKNKTTKIGSPQVLFQRP